MVHLDGIKAVIFDLDGLMIESESIGYQVWRQVVAEFGSEMSEALYREFIGKTPEATIDLVCEILGLSISPQDLSERYWSQRTATMCVEARAADGLVTLIDDLINKDAREENRHIIWCQSSGFGDFSKCIFKIP